MLSISDTQYSRIVKRPRRTRKEITCQTDYSKNEVSVKLHTALTLLGNLE